MNTNELFTNMKTLWNEFEEQHDKFTTKGSKSAGSKARKAIGELKKLVTEYRKVSVAEAKA
jgi:hypothetical protein